MLVNIKGETILYSAPDGCSIFLTFWWQLLRGVHVSIYFKQCKIIVSLQLRVQNRRRKWHFPLNFRNDIIWTSLFPLNICNSIIWTSPFPLNIRNAINWGGAFSKAFRSSEALISKLPKNAHLYFFSVKKLYIVLIFKWSHLDTNLWICNLCICQKTCQQNTNFW